MAWAVVPGFCSSQAQYSRHCLAARAGSVPAAPSSSSGPSSCSVGWSTDPLLIAVAAMIDPLSGSAIPPSLNRRPR